MKKFLALGAILLGLGLLSGGAKAQGAGSTSAAICVPITTTSGGVSVTTCVPVTSTNPLPVTSTGAGVSSNLAQIGGVTLGGATAVGTAASGNVQTTNAQILGGAISNASSGVAVSTNNIGTVGYLYGFNGTTWDQLQVDGSKNLQVDINGCSASTACNPNGQATMANSAPVVIASDQTSVHTTVDNFSNNPPAGFAPNGNYASLAITGTTAQTTLPAGTSVDVANIGVQPAYINLGTSGSVTATSSNLPIGGGQQICLTVGSNTNIAGISANGNSKTTLTLAGGTGACSGLGGSVTISAPPNDVSNGPTTFTGTNLGTVAVSSQGSGSTGIQVTGAGSSYTVNFEATIDNTNWFSVQCFTPTGGIATSTTTTGNWVCPAGGYQQVRANLAVHASGTIAITVNASNGSTQHPVTATGVAVSIADCADVTQGCKADAAGGTGSQTEISILKQLHLDVTGAIPAGSNTIGKVDVLGNAGAIMDSATGAAVSANALNVGVNVAGNTRIPTAVNPSGTVYATQVDLASVAGTTQLTGNGTTGAGSPRVTIASDNTAFAVNAQLAPVTSGGLSLYFVQPTASDNHAVIKNGAGQVYSVSVTNNSATINYLRLYNAGTGFNGCNSATNLVTQWAIPGNSTNAAGFMLDIAQGIAFATGISICVTSAYATNDTTNATASAMSVNIGYK